MFLDGRFKIILLVGSLTDLLLFPPQGRRDGGIPVCGKSNFLVTTDTTDVLSH